MRHRVAKKKLKRDSDHRKALLRNLSRSLILNGSIETTLTKAKFVRPYIEKLITKARSGSSVSNVNIINARLNSTEATRVLFDSLVQKFEGKNGGYTRITKLGFRKGDKAPMAKIELILPEEKPVKQKDLATEPAEDKKEEKPTKAKSPTRKPQSKKVEKGAVK